MCSHFVQLALLCFEFSFFFPNADTCLRKNNKDAATTGTVLFGMFPSAY